MVLYHDECATQNKGILKYFAPIMIFEVFKFQRNVQQYNILILYFAPLLCVANYVP